MTVTRTIGVLSGGLLIMLAVVMIRAETSRLENESARLDRQQAELKLESREREIEIARLRNPAIIRARVAGMWSSDVAPDKPAAARAGKTPAQLPKRTADRKGTARAGGNAAKKNLPRRGG